MYIHVHVYIHDMYKPCHVNTHLYRSFTHTRELSSVGYVIHEQRTVRAPTQHSWTRGVTAIHTDVMYNVHVRGTFQSANIRHSRLFRTQQYKEAEIREDTR